MDFDINVEKQIKKDIQDLRKLGYAQELYRVIGGFSNFAITFSVISVLSGLMFLYGYGLELLGPLNIWTWWVVGFFQLLLALSLGEIVSIYPLAGGVYQWTSRLSNPHIGWFCGCFSLLGWLACTAAIQYGNALFISTYFGFDINNTNIVILVTTLIVIAHSLINIFGIRIVAWFNDFSVNIHIIGVIMLVSLMLIFGQKHPLSIITINDYIPKDTLVLNFTMALLMSAWTLTAFDAAANVSEESINPSKVVPWGMLFAVLSSIVLGSLLLLSLNLALPDLSITLSSNMPPALFVVNNALGPTVYKFVAIFIILAQFTAGLSSQTVLIRILYSFSRDDCIPLSRIWKYVSTRYDTPVYSVLLVSAATLILCLFTSFLPTIASLSTLGIYLSHAIVLMVAVFNYNKIMSNRGRFHLGKYGKTIHIISFIWALFISAIMVIPPIGNIGKVFLVIAILILVFYYKIMRKKLKSYS
ncbi:amino acid permease [Desulfitibacter alkalitolerans]|uniref:amino acid permease n=1 Tax=Desulfitibacter alkalitolerans TaxID=264641 RepID=UPI0004880206|nr:amino acid permease [Desulfitibacter alkalitolerans]